jgi:ABC-type proline/glycine betaine transport system ATPase subunit
MRAGRLVQLGTGSELLRSPADAEVARLMSAPLRQARKVEALLRGAADPAGDEP